LNYSDMPLSRRGADAGSSLKATATWGPPWEAVCELGGRTHLLASACRPERCPVVRAVG
jgi:hypothetical protein